MKKNPIGKTGLEVTEIGFGTAALGGMPDTYGHDVDEASAYQTIHSIFDGPVNLIDSSRNYGFGRSEERIGKVIRERGGIPADFVVSTKLDRNMETGLFDADRVRRSFEESLTALGLDRVQMLHLHDPEYASDLKDVTKTGGALEALFRLKEEGLVTAVGLAMGRLDIMLDLMKDWQFDVVLTHNRYMLLNRSANALLDLASEKGIAVFNAAPYAGGVLAKGSAQVQRITYQEASDSDLDPIRQIEAICAKHGIAPGAAALQFSTHDKRITSTVLGVSRSSRIKQTLEWADANVPEALWDDLKAVPFSDQDPEANRVYVAG